MLTARHLAAPLLLHAAMIPASGQSCPREWGVLPIDAPGKYTAIVSFDPEGFGPGTWYASVKKQATSEGYRANVWRLGDATWEPIGAEFDGDVNALAVYDDDGDGPRPPALYAAGDFTTIGGAAITGVARWNGGAWEAVGAGITGRVHVLHVHDADGPGPARPVLVAGGSFTEAGGLPARRIAAWDGAEWSVLSTGMSNNVDALTMWDSDGPGPAPARLIAGGHFVSAGGTTARFIAQWDGAAWSSLAEGVGGAVSALAVFDHDADPSTPGRLIAGGSFRRAGAVEARYIAEWDGTVWRALGEGLSSAGVSLAVVPNDQTIRPELFAAMALPAEGIEPPTNTMSWSGSRWNLEVQPRRSMVTQLFVLDTSLFGIGDFDIADRRLAWFERLSGPPVITVQPASRSVDAWYDSSRLRVEASGPGFLSYQWRRNGKPLVGEQYIWGADRAELRLDRLRVADAGVFDCVVSNACGSTISEPAEVIVLCPGDLNGDGQSDWPDVMLFLDLFEAGDPRADIDGNGYVNTHDFTVLLEGWIDRC